jgi:hypothetical protein
MPPVSQSASAVNSSCTCGTTRGSGAIPTTSRLYPAARWTNALGRGERDGLDDLRGAANGHDRCRAHLDREVPGRHQILVRRFMGFSDRTGHPGPQVVERYRPDVDVAGE